MRKRTIHLPKNVSKRINRRKTKLGRKTAGGKRKPTYTVPQFLSYFEGYDFLQYFGLVRAHLQKKNKIDLNLLELLLYLYPLNYYTTEDYFEIPKSFKYNRIQMLVDMGLVSIVSVGRRKKDTIYTLSKKGKQIVTSFYEYLSQEKKIPTVVLNKQKAPAYDKMKVKLIKKINSQGATESRKRYFEGS